MRRAWPGWSRSCEPRPPPAHRPARSRRAGRGRGQPWPSVAPPRASGRSRPVVGDDTTVGQLGQQRPEAGRAVGRRAPARWASRRGARAPRRGSRRGPWGRSPPSRPLPPQPRRTPGAVRGGSNLPDDGRPMQDRPARRIERTDGPVSAPKAAAPGETVSWRRTWCRAGSTPRTGGGCCPRHRSPRRPSTVHEVPRLLLYCSWMNTALSAGPVVRGLDPAGAATDQLVLHGAGGGDLHHREGAAVRGPIGVLGRGRGGGEGLDGAELLRADAVDAEGTFAQGVPRPRPCPDPAVEQVSGNGPGRRRCCSRRPELAGGGHGVRRAADREDQRQGGDDERGLRSRRPGGGGSSGFSFRGSGARAPDGAHCPMRWTVLRSATNGGSRPRTSSSPRPLDVPPHLVAPEGARPTTGSVRRGSSNRARRPGPLHTPWADGGGGSGTAAHRHRPPGPASATSGRHPDPATRRLTLMGRIAPRADRAVHLVGRNAELARLDRLLDRPRRARAGSLRCSSRARRASARPCCSATSPMRPTAAGSWCSTGGHRARTGVTLRGVRRSLRRLPHGPPSRHRGGHARGRAPELEDLPGAASSDGAASGGRHPAQRRGPTTGSSPTGPSARCSSARRRRVPSLPAARRPPLGRPGLTELLAHLLRHLPAGPVLPPAGSGPNRSTPASPATWRWPPTGATPPSSSPARFRLDGRRTAPRRGDHRPPVDLRRQRRQPLLPGAPGAPRRVGRHPTDRAGDGVPDSVGSSPSRPS